MKNKLVVYGLIPVALGVGLIGANVASAHGLGFGFGKALSADEIATRQTEMFQSEADILGVSVDDVKGAWAKGETMQQLMQEKGISETTVQQKMKDLRTSQMKTELQALVDKGVITQAQMDSRLQYMQTAQDSPGRGGMGPGMRGFGF